MHQLKKLEIRIYQGAILLLICSSTFFLSQLLSSDKTGKKCKLTIRVIPTKVLYYSHRMELISRIVKMGDTVSFIHLRNYYLLLNKRGEFMDYAWIMANKWHYPVAMLAVYQEVLSAHYQKIELIDPITRTFTLEYLLKAYYTSKDKDFKEYIYGLMMDLEEKGYLKKKGNMFFIK